MRHSGFDIYAYPPKQSPPNSEQLNFRQVETQLWTKLVEAYARITERCLVGLCEASIAC